MLHTQIENEDIVERYARNKLALEARHAFEEHLLACHECFNKLQTMDQFLAGVHHAADHGLLGSNASSLSTQHSAWFSWALLATASAASVLAILTVWTYFVRMPQLREDLDRTSQQVQAERRFRLELEQKQKALSVETAEANVPLVMLQSVRAADDAADVLLQASAKHLVLWIELTPPRYREFRLDVFSDQDRLLTTIEHLARGPYGGIAASLPVDQLPAGDLRITLTGQDPLSPSVLADYHVRIRRP